MILQIDSPIVIFAQNNYPEGVRLLLGKKGFYDKLVSQTVLFYYYIGSNFHNRQSLQRVDSLLLRAIRAGNEEIIEMILDFPGFHFDFNNEENVEDCLLFRILRFNCPPRLFGKLLDRPEININLVSRVCQHAYFVLFTSSIY